MKEKEALFEGINQVVQDKLKESGQQPKSVTKAIKKSSAKLAKKLAGILKKFDKKRKKAEKKALKKNGVAAPIMAAGHQEVIKK